MVGMKWDPEFSRRRNLNLGKSYIDWKLECSEDDVATAQAELLDKNIISMFLKDDDDDDDDHDDRISPEAVKIGAFCGSVTLRSLTTAHENGPPREPIALLDERHAGGGIINRQSNNGPLTAQKLYEALKEPRTRSTYLETLNGVEEVSYPQRRHTCITDLDRWSIAAVFDTALRYPRKLYEALQEPRTQSTDCGISTGIEQVSYPQRRHTYITDLDRWSIAAVFGTALHYQRSAIRSLVYRHLQFRPWININIPTEGKRFELVFHLPYTSMRESTAPNIDARQFCDGRPLRRHQDVSFLDLRDSQRPIFRYEAQISCLVIGKNNLAWDTYRFDDICPAQGRMSVVNIYDEERICTEEVNDSEDGDGPRFAIDPSSRGRRCRLEELNSKSDPPVLDPRQFFLRALRCDLEHVTAELVRNIDLITTSIRDYQNRQSTENPKNTPNKQQTRRKVQALSTIEWIIKVKEVSNAQLMEISDGMNVLQTFFDKHKALFETDLCDPLVSRMTTILREWEGMKNTLESAVEECKNFIQDQQIWLEHESNEAERKSRLLSKFIYPVVIVAGMFSMQAHVLPFKASTGAFVWMVLITGLMIDFAYESTRYWQAVLALVDRLRFTGRLQKLRRNLGRMLRKGTAGRTVDDQQEGPPSRGFLRRRRNHAPPDSQAQEIGV